MRNNQVGKIVLERDERGFFAISIPNTPNELHYYQAGDLQKQDNGLPMAEETLATLLKVLQNICISPTESKFRKLKISNKRFGPVWQDSDMQQILVTLGFEEESGGVVILRSMQGGNDSSESLDGGQVFLLAAAVEQLQQVVMERMQHEERRADYERQLQLGMQTEGQGQGGSSQHGQHGLTCCVCSRPDLFEDEYHKPGTFLMRARSVRSAIHCVECKLNFVICGDCYNKVWIQKHDY